MSLKSVIQTVAVAMLAAFAIGAQAQFTPYGSITLEQARKAIAAAEAEARKNNWPMAIAVVDAGGHLVAFSRMDNTQVASVNIAQDKAFSAAAFRRPTKAFQDGLAGGGAGLRILALRGASPVDGGLPPPLTARDGADGKSPLIARKGNAERGRTAPFIFPAWPACAIASWRCRSISFVCRTPTASDPRSSGCLRG